mgnify:CR=1 FL=1
MAKKTIINKIESSKLDLIDNPEEKLLNKVETAITNTLPSEELETVSAVEDKEPIIDTEKELMNAWNLTAKTMMHVEEWKDFFLEVGYTGDYSWFIP